MHLITAQMEPSAYANLARSAIAAGLSTSFDRSSRTASLQVPHNRHQRNEQVIQWDVDHDAEDVVKSISYHLMTAGLPYYIRVVRSENDDDSATLQLIKR